MDAFAALAPRSDAYASLPISDAFDWSAVAQSLGTGEWYMVAFRSVRRPDADDMMLMRYDDRAHDEASRAPGFIHYFKGPLSADGSCLSFCMWSSRAEARAAAGKPLHAEAASLVAEMYLGYTLEFLRVHREASGPLRFDPYDAPAHDSPALDVRSSDPHAEPASPSVRDGPGPTIDLNPRPLAP
jgi:hypothetical protein